MEPYIQDNIVALGTPPGKSALAIIRISGPSLSSIYIQFTKKQPKDRFAQFSKIYHPVGGGVLDESIIIFYKSPNSFTGEDMIELSCHGSPAITNSLIAASIEIGCRPAAPGEFSMRSYLNGKMDLLQAEAIGHLVTSDSTLSTRAGLSHLGGRISQFLKLLKDNTLDVLSVIENELNFLEDEIVFSTTEKITLDIKKIRSSISKILSSTVVGKNIMSGVRVVLFGKPNSGKSTLFNALLGHNRAITSKEAGTTRDSIEAYFEIKGVPICLVDTAGLWKSNKSLDVLAVEKTKQELMRANICIILDPKSPSKLINVEFTKLFNGTKILVQSKSDLSLLSDNKNNEALPVSSKNETGISELLTRLSTCIVNTEQGLESSDFLITQRQFLLVENSLNHLSCALKQIEEGHGFDIVASTLRGFVDCISEVVGDVSDVDVINNIFNRFCVGK